MGTRAGRADSAIGDIERSAAQARLVLGRLLRRHRERAGLSRAAAAQATGLADTTVSGLEQGQIQVVRLRDVLRLCELYSVDDHDERAMLLDLAQEGNTPGWWAGFADIIPTWFEPYLALEQTSTRIRSFDLQFVPSLLQTPDYARALITMDEGQCDEFEREHRLSLRLARQRRLTAADAPRLWALIDESALRRRITDRPAMFRQLQHLADLCDLPRLRIQILPLLSRGHFTGGPIVLLSPPGDLPEIVYLEQLTTALYLDASEDVLYYRHVLNSLATIAPIPGKTQEILRRVMRDV